MRAVGWMAAPETICGVHAAENDKIKSLFDSIMKIIRTFPALHKDGASQLSNMDSSMQIDRKPLQFRRIKCLRLYLHRKDSFFRLEGHNFIAHATRHQAHEVQWA